MRNIGIEVNEPKEVCTDSKCPFHGELGVKSPIIQGKVTSVAMKGTVTVVREYLKKNPKYERYEKRRKRYHAHLPGCIHVKLGDVVKIAYARPLAKSVSFVVIEKEGGQ
ncbi:MAG: 30S ribosomal protein S17 [Candidatus Thermoplasmatota archaeon]|jgi:small subunit ribosomal protein S17|nr:30S ribosomal protein S17 [Candidatus Thermoplasmatota archaeon]MCL5790236.1 30S ribosomal protein S17 [Candidatus Thermoplasmatota archaeon]